MPQPTVVYIRQRHRYHHGGTSGGDIGRPLCRCHLHLRRSLLPSRSLRRTGQTHQEPVREDHLVLYGIHSGAVTQRQEQQGTALQYRCAGGWTLHSKQAQRGGSVPGKHQPAHSDGTRERPQRRTRALGETLLGLIDQPKHLAHKHASQTRQSNKREGMPSRQPSRLMFSGLALHKLPPRKPPAGGAQHLLQPAQARRKQRRSLGKAA